VSAGEDRTLKVWAPDAAVEASRPDHEGVVWACAFTPAGDLVLSAGSEGRLLAWDVEAPTARELGRHDGVVADCAVSDDGRFAASAGEDGVVGLYNLLGAAPPRRLCGHQSAVSVCVFCGSLLITGDRDGTCRTWSLPDGNQRSILEERAGQVWECAVPADHSYVACAHDGGRVTIWELPDGTLRHRFREQDGVVWTCGVSDDGRLVASGGHDGLIRVHDARDGSKVQVLRGHKGHVLRCRFAAPAGLLSSGADGTVRLWDLGAGREKTMLRLHQAAVRTFAVSPSGTFLVSGGQDGLIQITDLIAERVVCTLPLASRIWSLALHPHHPIFSCGGSGGVFHVVELVGSESRW
jgi:WD40 repeat protein